MNWNCTKLEVKIKFQMRDDGGKTGEGNGDEEREESNYIWRKISKA